MVDFIIINLGHGIIMNGRTKRELEYNRALEYKCMSILLYFRIRSLQPLLFKPILIHSFFSIQLDTVRGRSLVLHYHHIRAWVV